MHPLHEEIGNPVGRVHVMRAAALIACIFAQLEEIFDIEVPRLEIRAHRPFAFAAIVGKSCRRHV